MINYFDETYEIKMRVGALPLHPTNELKYNLTWSTDGLINEYCNPCETVIDGVKIENIESVKVTTGRPIISMDENNISVGEFIDFT